LLVHIGDQWRASGAQAPTPPESALRLVRPEPGSAVAGELEVRPARVADMRAVEPLIRLFANDNIMLPKTFDQLARTFREFVVATEGSGQVVGCGALRIYNEGLAEICSLAVDLPYQGGGIGRKIVTRLLDQARELDLKTVFALTLKPGFFERLGFNVVSKENFPLKVWADCRGCPKLHACDEIAVAIEIGE